MRTLVFALMALALPMEAQAAESKVNHVVEVEGRTYRVMVKGDEVRVFDKAVTWKKSLDQRARNAAGRDPRDRLPDHR
jgi:hypothetical protein